MKLNLSSNLHLAKTITRAENDAAFYEEIYRQIHEKIGNAIRVGLTGPPGAGKSTLVNQMVQRFCDAGKTIGILSIDASSPYTKGALLGDRIRFQTGKDVHEKVFYRSMANRGDAGGISDATGIAIDLIDFSGKDIILVETVGVGQTDLDVKDLVDVLIVALVPEAGDSIQMLKSGLMEAGDIYLVNKCDRQGAEQKAADIKQALEMQNIRYSENDCHIPSVFLTNARTGEGIEDVLRSIQNEYTRKKQSGALDNLIILRKKQMVQKLLHRRLQNFMDYTNIDFSGDNSNLHEIEMTLWKQFFEREIDHN